MSSNHSQPNGGDAGTFNATTTTNGASYGANRPRIVTDLCRIARKMWLLSPDQDRTNPGLVIAYSNLPNPIQKLVCNISCFHFSRRPAIAATDCKDMSQHASVVLNSLKSKAPLLAEHYLLLVGLKCAFCDTLSSEHVAGSMSFILLDEKHMVKSLELALQRQLNHIRECPLAKNAIHPDLHNHFLETYNEHDPNIRIFAQKWLYELQKQYFPVLATARGITEQLSPEPPQPPQQSPQMTNLYPQLRALYHYSHPQGNRPYVTAGGTAAVAAAASASPSIPTQSVIQHQAQPPTNVAPTLRIVQYHAQPPINRVPPLQHQFQPEQQQRRQQQQQDTCSRTLFVGIVDSDNLPKAKRIVELEQECDDMLDHLVWSIFSMNDDDMGYDSWDDDDNDDDSVDAHVGQSSTRPLSGRRKLHDSESMSLPEPKRPPVDVWVPLTSRQLTELPREMLLMGEGQGNSSIGGGGGGVGQSSHRKPIIDAEPNDVVIFCQSDTEQRLGLAFTAALATAAFELDGNRRFRNLISEHRRGYANLSVEEKRNVGLKVVQTIHDRSGSFLNAEVGGAGSSGSSKSDKMVSSPGVSSTRGIKYTEIAHGDALNYTLERLAEGFEDLWLVQSNAHHHLSDKKINNNGGSKVMNVEIPPQVGLIHGDLKWNNGSKKKDPRIKFSDVRIVRHQNVAVNSSRNVEANKGEEEESMNANQIIILNNDDSMEVDTTTAPKPNILSTEVATMTNALLEVPENGKIEAEGAEESQSIPPDLLNANVIVTVNKDGRMENDTTTTLDRAIILSTEMTTTTNSSMELSSKKENIEVTVAKESLSNQPALVNANVMVPHVTVPISEPNVLTINANHNEPHMLEADLNMTNTAAVEVPGEQHSSTKVVLLHSDNGGNLVDTIERSDTEALHRAENDTTTDVDVGDEVSMPDLFNADIQDLTNDLTKLQDNTLDVGLAEDCLLSRTEHETNEEDNSMSSAASQTNLFQYGSESPDMFQSHINPPSKRSFADVEQFDFQDSQALTSLYNNETPIRIANHNTGRNIVDDVGKTSGGQVDTSEGQVQKKPRLTEQALCSSMNSDSTNPDDGQLHTQR